MEYILSEVYFIILEVFKMIPDKKEENWLFKVSLVGEHMAGKTAIMKAMANQKIPPTYKSTIGCDFALVSETGNEAVKLQIWDIAAYEKSSFMFKLYIKDTNYFIVLFNINTENCLENIKQWIALIEEKRRENIAPIALMCTRFDKNVILSPKKEKELKEIKGFAFENNHPYFEANSNERENLSKIVNSISDYMLEEKLKSPEVIHKKHLGILTSEIERLSNISSFFDQTHLHKKEHLKILHQMLSTRNDKSTAELVEEWGNVEVTVKNYGFFEKTLKRRDLIQVHRNWSTWLFDNDAETTSTKKVLSLKRTP